MGEDGKQVSHSLWKLTRVEPELPSQERTENTAIKHLASMQRSWSEKPTVARDGGYCVCSWVGSHGMKAIGFFKTGEIVEKEHFVIRRSRLCPLETPRVVLRKLRDTDRSSNNFLPSLAGE